MTYYVPTSITILQGYLKWVMSVTQTLVPSWLRWSLLWTTGALPVSLDDCGSDPEAASWAAESRA